jgi:hypothetical protein
VIRAMAAAQALAAIVSELFQKPDQLRCGDLML